MAASSSPANLKPGLSSSDSRVYKPPKLGKDLTPLRLRPSADRSCVRPRIIKTDHAVSCVFAASRVPNQNALIDQLLDIALGRRERALRDTRPFWRAKLPFETVEIKIEQFALPLVDRKHRVPLPKFRLA